MRALVFGALLLAALALPARAAEVSAPDSLGVELARHRGQVVVVDFWASWCKPCRAELPWLAALRVKHGQDGLAVVTVNLDRDRELADKLLATLGITLPVIYDPAGELAAARRLEGMPTSLFYDRTGTLRAQHVGFVVQDGAKLEAELEALLAGGDKHGE